MTNKQKMRKKLIWIISLLITSIILFTLYNDANFKKVVIPQYGSIVVPKDWYVTNSYGGMILSNKSIDSSDLIIYMFQIEYENKENDWFAVNNEVGTFLVLGVDREGKGGVYSNNTQITALKLMINERTYSYYQLDIYTIRDITLKFMINAEYVKWPVVEKITQSFVEIN